MIYLIAKYAVLLFLAAFLGFLLGRWWLRRSFVDVTESYDTISKAASDAPWQRLWSRLDAIETGMRQIVSEELRVRPRPDAPKVDLSPLRQGIEEFAARIRAVSADGKPKAADFAPIHQRIDQLETLIKGWPKPETPKALELGPTNARIERLESLILAMPKAEKPEAVDLEPISRRLDGVESAIRAIEIPPAPDFGPVSDRLQVIEANISQFSQASSAKVGPRLLSSPTRGSKDDLKRISGIGPKLERLLNENGVYYFWQIAEWSAADIAVMDERLEAFKGRILRDHWVAQAADLMRHSSARTDGASVPQESGAST